MPSDAVKNLDAGIITKAGSASVDDSVSRLIQLIEDRGMTVFAIVDHSGEAERHGLELRDTKLVIFGSPAAGTPVMQASPLAALDLPLKVLVWDDDGQTRISYTDPDELARRYHLADDLTARLTGIGPLTDTVVG